MLRPFFPLLCACLALGSSQALALSGAEMQQRTAFIAERYLAIWSSNDGGAVADVPYMYGPMVQFYGRSYTQARSSRSGYGRSYSRSQPPRGGGSSYGS
jgi:hypothetical protein